MCQRIHTPLLSYIQLATITDVLLANNESIFDNILQSATNTIYLIKSTVLVSDI